VAVKKMAWMQHTAFSTADMSITMLLPMMPTPTHHIISPFHGKCNLSTNTAM